MSFALAATTRVAIQPTFRIIASRCVTGIRPRSVSLLLTMPKRNRTEQAVAAVVVVEPAHEPASRPERTRSAKKKTAEEAWDYPSGNESPLTDLDDDSPRKPKGKAAGKRRKKKSDAPVVYNIPPVEQKTTSFRGTLSL